MALATLMNADDPMFAFENDQQHNLYGNQYILDPDHGMDGGWLMDHQTAHNDFQQPPPPGSPIWGEAGGYPSQQNFQDINFADPEARAWWTWAHEREHANAAPPTGGSTPS